MTMCLCRIILSFGRMSFRKVHFIKDRLISAAGPSHGTATVQFLMDLLMTPVGVQVHDLALLVYDKKEMQSLYVFY